MADRKVEPNRQQLALKAACMGGNRDEIRKLLEQGVDPSWGVNVCLRCAIEANHPSVVDMLLSDRRVNAAEANNSALSLALTKGFIDIVVLLLHDQKVRTELGQRPLSSSLLYDVKAKYEGHDSAIMFVLPLIENELASLKIGDTDSAQPFAPDSL